MQCNKQQLHESSEELKEMVPEPMNNMVEQQSREEAIRKMSERLNMVAKDVPSTAPSMPGFSIFLGILPPFHCHSTTL